MDPVSDPADEAPDAAWANATAPRIYDEFEGQPVMALDPGPDCQILWCLTSIPGDHSPKDADRAVEFATRVWSRRTGVHFTSTPGCVDAALMIGESRQDGPDGRLGMLWFEGSAVHIEVDSDEWWSVQGDPGDVVVEFVIAHLLGHALGVGHSDRADDLMSPIYHSDRSLADQPWRDTPVQFDLGLAACHSGGR